MRIELNHLSDYQFQLFLSRTVEAVAEAQVKAGVWTEAYAPELAEQMVKELLPEGQRTPNEFVRTIEQTEGKNSVGYVWWGLRLECMKRLAAVRWLTVFKEYRRQGYATEALASIEDEAREVGADTITLDVCAYNEAARGLYRRCGYEERSLILAKALR